MIAILKLAFVLFLTVTASGMAWAGFPFSSSPCKKEDNALHLQKELSLTNQQKDQVKQLHEKYTAEVEEKTKTVKRLNEELIAQLQTPGKGNEANASLLDKFKKYQAARNDLYTTRFEIALKTRDLLTDEQIKKYKAFYHVKGKGDSKEKQAE